MKRLSLVWMCAALIVAGLVSQAVARQDVPPPAVSAPPPASVSEKPRPVAPLEPGQSFSLDVAMLRGKLGELRADERPEQIADWTVYGTLAYAGISDAVMRQVLYDKVPFRDPALEETANFDYGAGRRAIVEDNSVWLFRSEQDPHPAATLGRLADQVRMELGKIPETFSIFTYRSDLIHGAIHVRFQERLPGKELFSPRYGYVERSVSNEQELGQWLASVDDVTHIGLQATGSVELGGRRFQEARTENVSLEDVAALYQAHVRIAQSQKQVSVLSELGDAFNELVNQYNLYERAIGGAARQESFLKRQKEIGHEVSRLENRVYKGSVASLSGDTSMPGLLRRLTRLQEDWPRYQAELFRKGELLPGEPGFSLDPQWDPAGMVADLQLLLHNPEALVARARRVVREGGNLHPLDATPSAMEAARGVVGAFPPGATRFQLTPEQRETVEKVVEEWRGAASPEAHARAAVSLSVIKDSLRKEDPTPPKTQKEFLDQLLREATTFQLMMLLDYIESEQAFQCARYDGPLQGTRVGMNLFYTDLMAKLWASVDYYHSAPVDVVHGFQSKPRIGELIEPAYWEESERLNSTRLWFGTRRDGYAMAPDSHEVNFAHVGARVFSLGSSGLDRKQEEVLASEFSRRAYNWWDRHYAAVADYEQQYHVQNQIMKWSVVTGWLAREARLQGLDKVEVDRSLRFDTWYARSGNLKFRGDVRVIPRSRWPSGTECIELLRSYPFTMANNVIYIQGGVSLGSARSLETGARISDDVAIALRRGGLDYSGAGRDAVKSLRGTNFTLPPVHSQLETPRVLLNPSATARLRAGGTELRNVTQFTLDYVSSPGAGRSVIMRAGEHELGRLAFERAEGGLRLGWHDGALPEVNGVAKALANANGPRQLDPIDVAQRLGPNQGVYLVESDVGLEAMVGGADGRGVRIVPEKAGNSNAFLATHGDQGTGKGVVALPLRDEPLSARLESTRWQRLEPIRDEGVDAPGDVHRLFTNEGPGDEAKRVLLALGGRELLPVEGFVEDGVLFLRRPEDPRARALFNDVVTREGWSSRTVSEMVEQAERGAAQVGPTQARTAAGARMADTIESGQPELALEQLRAANKQHALNEVLPSFEQRAEARARGELLGGRPSAAARMFAQAGAPEDPGLLMRDALSRLEMRDLPSVVGLAGKMARRTDDEPVLKALTHQLLGRPDDGAELGRFIRARTDLESGLAPELKPDFQLKPSGKVLLTSLDVKRPLEGQVLPMARRQEIAAKLAKEPGAEVYIEDSKLLGQFDWDAAPGRSLSEVARDERVIWEEVDVAMLGVVRPTELVDSGRQYLKRPVSDATSSRRSVALSTATRMYRVRSCDLDGDGGVSTQERERCAG